MITLNTAKGLVRISNWQEILDRPDYRPRIAPLSSPLKEVIGGYEFDEEVHCGLPCNQPHNRGWLVVTTDGLVTNIGKDCGKKHFGLEFEAARVSYERERERFERKEAIRRAKNRLPALREEVAAIKAGGATWVNGELRKLLEPGHVPQVIRAALAQMVKSGTARVVIDKRVSSETQKSMEDQAGRRLPPQFEPFPLGVLAGMGALSPDRDLRKLITDGLVTKLDHLNEINEDEASDRDLGVAAKFANGVDQALQDARDAVQMGKQLLTGANLAVLEKLLKDPDDSKAFRTYLRLLPAGG